MNTASLKRKEALRLYAHSLHIQNSLQVRVQSEPFYQLSPEESLQYLDALRKEQDARLYIQELFTAE